MKRILLVLVFLACSLGAQAQGGFAQVEKEYKLFDFQLNAKRMEFGLNVGQAGSFSPRTCSLMVSIWIFWPLTQTTNTAGQAIRSGMTT